MPEFKASQKFSQDEKGEFLILIDASNYGSDTIPLSDFLTRRWEMEDINGIKTTVTLPYTISEDISAMVSISKDEYFKITLFVSTVGEDFFIENETGLTRRASYKKKLIIDGSVKCRCSNTERDKRLIDSTQLIDSAIIDLRTYNPVGFNDKIHSANQLLNTIL